MPKTPHSSRGPSRWSVREQPVDPQLIPAHLADNHEPGQSRARAGHDEPPTRRLTERIQPSRQPNRCANVAGNAALGERDRDTALGDVVGTAECPRTHTGADGLVRDPKRSTLNRRQFPNGRESPQLRELRTNRGRIERTDQRDQVARREEPQPPWARSMRQLPHHPDHGRGEDRAGRRLVIQRHIPTHDRHPERLARLGQPLDRLDQLPGDVRLLRVAEVQTVGQPERLGAHAGQVGRALVHRLGRAAPRVARHAPAVPVDRHGDRGPVREHEHGGVGLVGPAHGARLNDRVVLLEHRSARGHVRRPQQREQDLPRRLGSAQNSRRRSVQIARWRFRLEIVKRAVINQDMHR
jgi:hypothetical protein